MKWKVKGKDLLRVRYSYKSLNLIIILTIIGFLTFNFLLGNTFDLLLYSGVFGFAIIFSIFEAIIIYNKDYEIELNLHKSENTIECKIGKRYTTLDMDKIKEMKIKDNILFIKMNFINRKDIPIDPEIHSDLKKYLDF